MHIDIESKNNRIIKLCRKLTMKKYRDEESMYIVEGDNLVKEAFDNNAEIYAVLIREGEKSIYKGNDLSYIVDSFIFDSIAQTQTSQGIMAIVYKKKYTAVDMIQHAAKRNFVILDRLQDPGNIGTIIRTAEGAGYDGIIALRGTADIFSPKVIRAAAGSVFRIPIIQTQEDGEIRKLVKEQGLRLVVTGLQGKTYYYEENLKENIALVIGNEGNGVSKQFIDEADVILKIPMAGKLESLNAAVSAGIVMYEAMRK